MSRPCIDAGAIVKPDRKAADTVGDQGRLLVFEGIDGTGKSTQVGMLAEWLRRRGEEVVVTREPTDGPHGRKIRSLYEDRSAVSPEQELDLFLADRRQHVREVIIPALEAGRIVVSDRYYLSTAAYQGAKGLDYRRILEHNETFAPRPRLAFLLVLDPAQAVHRIQTLRGQRLNSFEQESELRRVAEIFSRLPGEYIRRLDANRPAAEIHGLVRRQVLPLVGRGTRPLSAGK